MNFQIGMTVVENDTRHFGIVMDKVYEEERVKGYIIRFYDPKKKEFYRSYSPSWDLLPVPEDHYVHQSILNRSEIEEDHRQICRDLALLTADRSWYENQF